ncbi:hypothetical protein [Nocardia sp. NPDC049149]|uniref:WXG100-like domain-containing protein n=1 Tax=Nocardia sp. NPDC049149 TaxID=3364315 RepID=UPI0037203E96
MSLYLPEELRWLGWIAGAAWPDGDEDKMFELARAWDRASTKVRPLTDQVLMARRAAERSWEGEGGRAIAAAYDALLHGDQSLDRLAEHLLQVSKAVFNTGTELEATKLTIIVSLLALAVEIAWAWMFPPTAPAAEAAAVAATRSFLRTLEDELAKKVVALASQLAQKVGVRTSLVKNLGLYAMKIPESMLISGGLDLVVQGAQLAKGTRKELNWKQTLISMAASGVGTYPGIKSARQVGRGFDRLAGKTFAPKVGDSVRWATVKPMTGDMLKGTATGVVSGAVGTFFGNAVLAPIVGASAMTSAESWVGGMVRGGMVGAARGGFGVKMAPADGKLGPFSRVFDSSMTPVRDGAIPQPSRDTHELQPMGSSATPSDVAPLPTQGARPDSPQISTPVGGVAHSSADSPRASVASAHDSAPTPASRAAAEPSVTGASEATPASAYGSQGGPNVNPHAAGADSRPSPPISSASSSDVGRTGAEAIGARGGSMPTGTTSTGTTTPTGTTTSTGTTTPTGTTTSTGATTPGTTTPTGTSPAGARAAEGGPHSPVAADTNAQPVNAGPSATAQAPHSPVAESPSHAASPASEEMVRPVDHGRSDSPDSARRDPAHRDSSGPSSSDGPEQTSTRPPSLSEGTHPVPVPLSEGTPPQTPGRTVLPDGKVQVVRADGSVWVIDYDGTAHKVTPDGETVTKSTALAGGELKGKTRPKKWPDHVPMPEPYCWTGTPGSG